MNLIACGLRRRGIVVFGGFLLLLGLLSTPAKAQNTGDPRLYILTEYSAALYEGFRWSYYRVEYDLRERLSFNFFRHAFDRVRLGVSSEISTIADFKDAKVIVNPELWNRASGRSRVEAFAQAYLKAIWSEFSYGVGAESAFPYTGRRLTEVVDGILESDKFQNRLHKLMTETLRGGTSSYGRDEGRSETFTPSAFSRMARSVADRLTESCSLMPPLPGAGVNIWYNRKDKLFPMLIEAAKGVKLPEGESRRWVVEITGAVAKPISKSESGELVLVPTLRLDLDSAEWQGTTEYQRELLVLHALLISIGEQSEGETRQALMASQMLEGLRYAEKDPQHRAMVELFKKNGHRCF